MVRRALAVLLMLTSCGEANGPNEIAQTSAAFANTTSLPAQAGEQSEANALASSDQAAKPSEDDRPAPNVTAGLTRERLLGRWTNPDSGTCGGGDAAVDLRSDGSYVTSEGDGRWRLEGTTLHMTNWGGAPAQLELRANGDLAVTWDYGSEIWRRCPS